MRALLTLTALIAVVAGCSPAGSGTETAPGGPVPATAAPVDAATAELVAAARKRLAADEALVANTGGYEQALKKQQRQRVESGMEARVIAAGAAVTTETLTAALRAAADEAGVLVGVPRVMSHGAAEPVPAEHRGDGPYAYAPGQLYASIDVEVELPAGDAVSARRLLKALADKGQPLPFVRELRPVPGGVVLVGTWLREAGAAPPRRVVPALTVAALAAEARVPVPAVTPPEVEALLAAHARLEPAMERALEVLGRSHLEAARYRVYSDYGARADGVLGGRP